MEITEILGFVAGICTSVSSLPQLIKIIKNKKAEDVSVVMLVVLIAGVCLWVVYGIAKKDWPIIITNVFSLLINVVVIILRIKYAGAKE